METDDAELLTLEEAVQFLGTSKPTLYRLLSQGDIKGLKVGRQWRFRKSDLVAYMERSPAAIAPAPIADLDQELSFFALLLQPEDKQVEAVTDEDGNEAEIKTIRLTHFIIRLALDRHASDIHLELAYPEDCLVSLLRFRIDGVLHEIRRMPNTVHEGLITRFKMMADVSITEHRMPQAGRIPIRHEEKDFDFHTSIIPAIFGEAIAMRIWAKSDVNVVPGLEQINLSAEEQVQFRQWMQKPSGLILFVGPEGSGKTTTVLSALHAQATPKIKTMTLEYPFELRLPYVTQVQLHPSAGLTYAAGLRAALRQDPDILYVADLPDPEATRLALEVALSGHLVLAALSVSDVASALSSLMDMGIEPHLIAATVIGITAQRLCRTICSHCKEAYQVPARTLLRFGLEPPDPDQTVTLFRGRGCDRCRNRGFQGRTAIYEILEMTEEIADLLVGRAPLAEIHAAAQATGMNTLTQAGLLKVLDGVTTPEEVMRVALIG